MLEFVDVVELPTVGQRVCGFDRMAQSILMAGKIFRQRTDSIFNPVLSLRHNTITITPATDDVEILQSEARRINP